MPLPAIWESTDYLSQWQKAVTGKTFDRIEEARPFT